MTSQAVRQDGVAKERELGPETGNVQGLARTDRQFGRDCSGTDDRVSTGLPEPGDGGYHVIDRHVDVFFGVEPSDAESEAGT